MEGFFSSLKTGQTARKTYRTRDEAKADVFDCVERFYNPSSAIRRWAIYGEDALKVVATRVIGDNQSDDIAETIERFAL